MYSIYIYIYIYIYMHSCMDVYNMCMYIVCAMLSCRKCAEGSAHALLMCSIGPCDDHA